MRGFWKRIKSFYALPLYIMIHPIDGFHQMKFEKKGTMWLAAFNFFMLGLSMSIMDQFSSIIVDQSHPQAINSIQNFVTIGGALMLFSVGNWTITSLTDGEGKLYEIIMTICYAMTPMVLVYIPATILSNFITLEEAAFYYMILSVAVAYFVGLAFLGLIIVHNYTLFKSIFMMVLTIFAILVIVFLLALMFTLWQQLYAFFYSIYVEMSFRM